MKKALFLMLIMANILGCGDADFKDKNPAADEPPKLKINSAQLTDNLKVAIVGADPEKYTVQFSWPYIEDNRILRIRLVNVLTEVKPNQTFFTHTVDHNQTLTYSIDVLDSNRNPERTIRKSVVIPFDYVANDKNRISADTKIEANRIYLTKDNPITTNGKNVEIVANEVHAKSGVIQTFPETIIINDNGDETVPTAPDFQNGSSGGNIVIHATKLYGKLKVYMRGERGGKGNKGEPTPGRAGEGTPATVGEEVCYDGCTSISCFTSQFMRRGERSCGCKHMGGAGGQGQKGITGKAGAVGMVGGASGNVKVNIETYIPLEGIDPGLPSDTSRPVLVFQSPGEGGQGGDGGDGQMGGPGGPPLSNRRCTGPIGPDGLRGDPGPRGPAGNPGSVGMKCIYIGSENINECN